MRISDLRPRHRWCLGMAVAIPLSWAVAILGATSGSYAVWAATGTAGAGLLLIGLGVAINTLILDRREGPKASRFWGLLLLAMSGLPLATLFLFGALIGA